MIGCGRVDELCSGIRRNSLISIISSLYTNYFELKCFTLELPSMISTGSEGTYAERPLKPIWSGMKKELPKRS